MNMMVGVCVCVCVCVGSWGEGASTNGGCMGENIDKVSLWGSVEGGGGSRGL